MRARPKGLSRRLAGPFAGILLVAPQNIKGNIVPVECDDGNCQSTMLSWFFQWASWMFGGIIFAFRCLVASRRTISLALKA